MNKCRLDWHSSVYKTIRFEYYSAALNQSSVTGRFAQLSVTTSILSPPFALPAATAAAADYSECQSQVCVLIGPPAASSPTAREANADTRMNYLHLRVSGLMQVSDSYADVYCTFNKQVVKVIWQKAASPSRMNHSLICSQKTFCFNGFRIKRFAHRYCQCVLF